MIPTTNKKAPNHGCYQAAPGDGQKYWMRWVYFIVGFACWGRCNEKDATWEQAPCRSARTYHGRCLCVCWWNVHTAPDKSEPTWKRVWEKRLNKAGVKCKDSISLWSRQSLEWSAVMQIGKGAAIIRERYGLDMDWQRTSLILCHSFGSQNSSPNFLSLGSFTVFREIRGEKQLGKSLSVM